MRPLCKMVMSTPFSAPRPLQNRLFPTLQESLCCISLRKRPSHHQSKPTFGFLTGHHFHGETRMMLRSRKVGPPTTLQLDFFLTLATTAPTHERRQLSLVCVPLLRFGAQVKSKTRRPGETRFLGPHSLHSCATSPITTTGFQMPHETNGGRWTNICQPCSPFASFQICFQDHAFEVWTQKCS